MGDYIKLDTRGLVFQLTKSYFVEGRKGEAREMWDVSVFGTSPTAVQQVPGCNAKRCGPGEDIYLKTLKISDRIFMSALMRNHEDITDELLDLDGEALAQQKKNNWESTWRKNFIDKKYFTASQITIDREHVVFKLLDFKWSSSALSGKEVPEYIASENLHKEITKRLDKVRSYWKDKQIEKMCDELVSACEYFTNSIPLLAEFTNAQDQHLSHAMHEMFDMLSVRLDVEKPATYSRHKIKSISSRNRVFKAAKVLAQAARPLFDGQLSLLKQIDQTKNFRSFLPKTGREQSKPFSETEEVRDECANKENCVSKGRGKVTVLKGGNGVCVKCIKAEGDREWADVLGGNQQPENKHLQDEDKPARKPRESRPKPPPQQIAVSSQPETPFPDGDILWAERVLRPYKMSRHNYKQDSILLEDIEKLRDGKNEDHVDELVHALNTLRGLDDVNMSTLPPMEYKVEIKGTNKVKKGRNKGKTTFKL
eukprot:TRINITY_DN11754_c0_g1_i1.p1 TRINITY_DN11754_c0_g1~~TRINITY_DN11754_c0_g1_i1.p1  ORF type:complete len:506 (+),score=86.77 TRINITY_DN11754_c0_g1_i1:77-1519(+)